MKGLGKLKIDQKLLVDAVIAGLIVQQAPHLLNSFVFKSNPLTGITLTAAGAGAGVVAGMLLKKPDVSNIAIALGALELINEFLTPMLLGMGGGSPAGAPAIKDFLSIDQGGSLALSDYTNFPQVMGASQYVKDYNSYN